MLDAIKADYSTKKGDDKRLFLSAKEDDILYSETLGDISKEEYAEALSWIKAEQNKL